MLSNEMAWEHIKQHAKPEIAPSRTGQRRGTLGPFRLLVLLLSHALCRGAINQFLAEAAAATPTENVKTDVADSNSRREIATAGGHGRGTEYTSNGGTDEGTACMRPIQQ